MGLPGVSSTSLLEVLFHLLQVTGTTPAQGLQQQQSWAETHNCNSHKTNRKQPLAARERPFGTDIQVLWILQVLGWDRAQPGWMCLGVSNGLRAWCEGAWCDVSRLGCGDSATGTGWGATARGVLSTSLSGCSNVIPRSSILAVQGQLQHTELLSCTTAEEGDGFYSPASLASVWFQGGQTGFSQACSPTH